MDVGYLLRSVPSRVVARHGLAVRIVGEEDSVVVLGRKTFVLCRMSRGDGGNGNELALR